MKKIISILALISFALFPNIALAANSIYGSYDKDTKTVTVNGHIDDCQNERVIVTVLKSGKENLSGITADTADSYILHYEQVITNENGDFTLSYKTESDGIFKVFANAGGEGKNCEGVLSYGEGFMKMIIENSIEPLRDPDNKNDDLDERIAKLRTVLQGEGVIEILGIYKDNLPQSIEADKASSDAIGIFLSYNEKYPTDSEKFKDIFAGAVMADIFNNAQKDEIYNLVKTLKTFLPSKYEKIISEYEKLSGSNDALLDVINEKLAAESFTSSDDIAQKICDNYSVESLKNMDNYTEFSAFAYSLGASIGLDMEKYNSIVSPRDKTNVDKAVINAKSSINTLNALIKRFSEECDNELNRVITTDSGNKGSSSSSRGSGGLGSISVPKIPQTVEKPSFTDISDAHWAYDYINYLVENKIMAGYDDDTVKPENFIKREEFVKLIVSAFDEANKNAQSYFDDVSKTDWSYEFISTAAANGYINGISKNLFGLGNYITREDAAVIINNVCIAKKINLATKRSYNEFADRDSISDYAIDSVKNLYCANIIDGTGSGFEPKENITRAQAAKIIYGILKIKKG